MVCPALCFSFLVSEKTIFPLGTPLVLAVRLTIGSVYVSEVGITQSVTLHHFLFIIRFFNIRGKLSTPIPHTNLTNGMN